MYWRKCAESLCPHHFYGVVLYTYVMSLYPCELVYCSSYGTLGRFCYNNQLGWCRWKVRFLSETSHYYCGFWHCSKIRFIHTCIYSVYLTSYWYLGGLNTLMGKGRGGLLDHSLDRETLLTRSLTALRVMLFVSKNLSSGSEVIIKLCTCFWALGLCIVNR